MPWFVATETRWERLPDYPEFDAWIRACDEDALKFRVGLHREHRYSDQRFKILGEDMFYEVEIKNDRVNTRKFWCLQSGVARFVIEKYDHETLISASRLGVMPSTVAQVYATGMFHWIPTLDPSMIPLSQASGHVLLVNCLRTAMLGHVPETRVQRVESLLNDYRVTGDIYPKVLQKLELLKAAGRINEDYTMSREDMTELLDEEALN